MCFGGYVYLFFLGIVILVELLGFKVGIDVFVVDIYRWIFEFFVSSVDVIFFFRIFVLFFAYIKFLECLIILT